MGLFKTRREVFCAFCKSKRKIYIRKTIGFTEWVLALTTTIAASFALYQGLDARLLPVFILILLASEIGIRMRRRMSLQCQKCGFDPILYGKNPDLAAIRVRETLARRKLDPRAVLSSPINLPKVRRSAHSDNHADSHRHPDLQ